MTIDKKEILRKICYTTLVYERINKKLKTNLSKKEIEEFILETLQETKETHFSKIGKNYYITNEKNNIRITINSNTYRIITVDKLNNRI